MLATLAGAAVLLPIGGMAAQSSVPLDYVRDDLEAQFLHQVRQLDERQRAALLRFMQRTVAGMPTRDGAILFYRDCGMDEAEALRHAADVLRGFRT